MSTEEKEMLRHATLECLAARHPTALAPAGIRRRVAVQLDFKIDDEDLASALAFWLNDGKASFEYDGAGATKYWQATSAGVLFIERGR